MAYSKKPKKKMTKENYFNRKKSIDDMDRNMSGLGLTTKVIGGGLDLAKKAVTGIQRELTKKVTQKGVEKVTQKVAKKGIQKATQKLAKKAAKDMSSKTTGAALSSTRTAGFSSMNPAAREVTKGIKKKLTSRGMKPRSNSLSSSINKGRLQGGAAAVVGARMGQDMSDRNKTNNEEFVNEAKKRNLSQEDLFNFSELFKLMKPRVMSLVIFTCA